MGDSQTSKKSDVVVILTLASTGLMKPGFDPEIVQLTLMKLDGKKLFSKCVLPQGAFQEAARDFNGFQIAVVKGKRHLMRNGKQVKAYALEKVVDDFLLEISSLRAQVSGRIVLTGYNNKNFDIPLLTKECSKIGISLSERFADMDIVCADLYQLLFHNRYTLLPLHDGDLKMTTVYNVLCRAQQAHRHDAIEDAEKLRAIHGKLVGPGFAQTFKTCIFSVFQSPVARQPQLPWRRSVKRQNFEDDIGELQGAQGSSCKKRRT